MSTTYAMSQAIPRARFGAVSNCTAITSSIQVRTVTSTVEKKKVGLDAYKKRQDYFLKRAEKLEKQKQRGKGMTDLRQEQQAFKMARSEYTQSLKAVKRALKEDYEMGDLAPRRDAFEGPDITYGTASQRTIDAHSAALMPGPLRRHWKGEGRFGTSKRFRKEGWTELPLDREERVAAWQAWKDGTEWYSLPREMREESMKLEWWLKPDWVKTGNEFKVGDHVVVTKGVQRGQISSVTKVVEEKDGIELKELNRVEVEVPNWMQKATQQPSPIQLYSRYTHPSMLKLITSVENQWLVLDKMLLERRWNPKKGEYRLIRKIPMMLTEIDPIEEEDADIEELEPNVPAGDHDTLRITTEDVTFYPVLQTSEMPTSVINELRGKHSKFRTRLDPKKLRKLEKIDAEAIDKEASLVKMRTPMQELALLRGKEIQRRREEKAEKEGSLENVGKEIWRHLQEKAAKEGQMPNMDKELGRAMLVSEQIHRAAQAEA